MSEATYRITLTHKPENGTAVCWHGAVYAEEEFEAHALEHTTPPLPIFDTFRATREDAFDSAQAWCKAKAH